jgi:small subunit ribosomal protein S9
LIAEDSEREQPEEGGEAPEAPDAAEAADSPAEQDAPAPDPAPGGEDGGTEPEEASGSDAVATPDAADDAAEAPEGTSGADAGDAGGAAQSTDAEQAGGAAEAAEAAEAEQPGVAEETPASAPAAEAPARGGEKKKDVVPGANLEPIAITEERELTAEERARLEAEEEERARLEAARAEDEEELPHRGAVAVPTDASIQATGKRKSSVARVLLRSGEGRIEINGRELSEYFPRPYHQSMARQPLVTAGYDGNVDVRIRVHGGGITGQAGAVRHGIARALTELDPELRGELKRRGLLTRDAREKERRKAGLKKARKRPQFSKR